MHELYISYSEKVRNVPDYFGGMGGCWGVMVIGKVHHISFSHSFCYIPDYIVSRVTFGEMFMCNQWSFKIAYNRYIFAHYHPTNIIWNVATNSGLRYIWYAIKRAKNSYCKHSGDTDLFLLLDLFLHVLLLLAGTHSTDSWIIYIQDITRTCINLLKPTQMLYAVSDVVHQQEAHI